MERRTAFANNSRGTICKLSRCLRKARRKLADDEQSLQEVTAELSAKIASEAAERGRNESRDRFGYGKTDTAQSREHMHTITIPFVSAPSFIFPHFPTSLTYVRMGRGNSSERQKGGYEGAYLKMKKNVC